MSKWTTKKLKDITTKIGSGATPRGGKGVYYQKGIPLIRSLNIYDLNFNYDDLAFIDEVQAKKLDNVTIEKDDILLNITGASVCRCTSVPDAMVPARVNQHVSIIRADKKNLLGKYLKYILVSSPYKQSLYSLATTGATREALTKSDIENFEIKLPDIETQDLIVSVISAYDELIDNNKKRIKILEEMSQLLYTEWFVNFKFPGFDEENLVESNTEYGKIPEGWEVQRLKDVVFPQYGYTASAEINDSFPKYLRGTDINKNTFIDWMQVPNCQIASKDFERYKISKGDVFIIRMADPGKIGICEREIKAVFASYLMRLNIKEYLTPYYLYYFVTSEKYQGFVLGASSGTTRKSVNSQQVGLINVIIPSKKILDAFENKVGLLRGHLTKLVEQNNTLAKIRDLLIPQLITARRELQ